MRGKNKGTRLGLALLCISVILIGSGIYISYLSNPKRIISNAMKDLKTSLKLENINEIIINEQISEKEQLNDITVASNIKTTANSQYLIEKANLESTYLQYVNFLKNISNLESNINYIQDNKNEKLLFTINSYLYNQPFINRKYLIQDTTEYQYIEELKNSYINNGNNNYFETTTSQIENIKYLYSLIMTSLENNLKDEYFTTTKEKITINNTEQLSNKVSLIIDNQISEELLKKIINTLENDKPAVNILKSFNIDTNKLNEIKTLSKDQKIIFNVYTDRISYKAIKYELLVMNSKNTLTITYEYNLGIGQIINNNELIYKYQITKNNSSIKVNIFSKENKDIGSIIIENTDNHKEISLTYDDGNINSIGNYKIEFTTIKDDYTYSLLQEFNLRITSKVIELINISSLIDTKIEYEAKIEEDTSTSILKSGITEEEREFYNNQMNEKINKIYQ